MGLVENLHAVDLPDEVPGPQAGGLGHGVLEDTADLDGEGLVQSPGQGEPPGEGGGGAGERELWRQVDQVSRIIKSNQP